MKYMGSKRFMLQNGLGELIRKVGNKPQYNRFVDLFSGSGSVAHFASQELNKPVLATDLQEYSRVFAASVIERVTVFDSLIFETDWLEPVLKRLKQHPLYNEAVEASLVSEGHTLVYQVAKARLLCTKIARIGAVWAAYGGFYFSPLQALTCDYLRKYLPENEPDRNIALAALLIAASRCVASPGHTAQPFKPTETGGKYVVQAWNRDFIESVKKALGELAVQCANVQGEALCADAFTVFEQLNATDLVFVDPPYSSEQYSRFYHVLETISQGRCGEVTGEGRYPDAKYRPKSDFSLHSKSKVALENLLAGLAGTGATLIFTFPKNKCSNGLSGDLVHKLAKKWFRVSVKEKVLGSFSTLGGKNSNESNRLPRQDSVELIFLMTPKVRR